ncbi:MAG TPA: hypothetical protein VFG15_15045, partial [Amycolatopsis sp.]|nr:hypothetical protein [Amycolatopsis sp.]
AVTGSGEAVVTPTAYHGTPGFRVAFSNWRTTESDVDRLCTSLTTAAAHVAAMGDFAPADDSPR